jgi:hypothetical protein
MSAAAELDRRREFEHVCFDIDAIKFIAVCKIVGGHAFVDQKRHISTPIS